MMQPVTESRLTRIGLSYFQTISEYVQVPIGKLTLLFGPNSAGKSAIADALDVAASVWAGRRVGADDFGITHLAGIEQLNDRHRPWSSTNDENDLFLGETRIDLWLELRPLSVNQTFPVHQAVQSDFPTLFDRMTGFDGHQGTLEVAARLAVSDIKLPSAPKWPTTCVRISLDIAGQPIARLITGWVGASYEMESMKGSANGLAINLQHPLIQADSWSVEELEVAATEQGLLRLEDGWLRYSGDWQLLAQNRIILNDPSTSAAADSSALHRFRAVWDFLFDDVGGRIAEVAQTARVPASRHVPSSNDLTFFFGDTRGLPAIHADGDARYRDLARQLARRRLNEQPADGSSEPLYLSHFRGQRRVGGIDIDLPACVDGVLLGHLFVEKGYRLDCDVFEIKLLNSASSPAFLVRVKLRGKSDRPFDFHDVGSGIGYLLPVLVEGYQSIQTFMEQPELHLHPALQSRLGDALIEMANAGRSLVIETHSEHLLLRMLRRVRQTTAGKVEQALQLSPSELVCLYFEPSVDGPTKIRHLRVTPAGDFMDRWPRGFFDSRDEDLFDE